MQGKKEPELAQAISAAALHSLGEASDIMKKAEVNMVGNHLMPEFVLHAERWEM